MELHDLATKIIQLVGTEENISVFTHCATRLRFNLKDNSKADIEQLKNLPGVLTAQEKGGQVQVVIGAKVQSVFDEISSMITITEGDSIKKDVKKGKISAVIETIAGIFAPTLPVLIGCGMFKAVVSLLTNLNVMQSTDSFIVILTMIGDLIFYFFPFFLAVSSARKFKVSEYMALALAGAYMYPTIMDGAAAASSGGPSTMSFLGLPILFVNYKSTVIPIILSVWVLSLIYKRIDKLVPDALKILLTSMIVLFIMVPFELIVLGPIGSYLGTYIAQFMDWFYNIGGFIAAALLGGTRSLLTMMGMHYALAPLQIQQIAETGTSTLLVSALTANFAQGGAALGVGLATKSKSERSVALSAALSAILGITEPAMYGVNLKHKKPFVFALIASAISAAFLSFLHAGAMAYAPPGLFTIITYTADNFVFIIIGALMSVVIAAVLSFFFGVEKSENVEPTEEGFRSPLNGKLIPLSEINDETFSSGAMGSGFGIIPSDDVVKAPIDAEVTMVFPTKHAIGLKGNDGTEILIHIGLDTVNENGNYFEAFVKQGDKVASGQDLIYFNLNELFKKYDMTTAVIVTNKEIKMLDKKEIQNNEIVLGV